MKTLIIAYLLLFTATTLQAQEAYRKYTNEMNRIVNERDVIYKSILRGKALVTFYNERKKETDIKAAERETGAQLLHFVDYDTHAAYNFLLANVSRDEINKFLTYIPKEGRTTIRAMVANTVKNANSGAPSTYASNLPKHGTGLKGTWKSHTAIANSNTLPQQPSNGIAEYNKAITAYRAKNNSEAMTWFKQSADKGNANAMFDIGAMYYNGDGVAKNETEAVQWYQKAADNGHDKAKSLLHLIKEQAKYADQLRQTNDTGKDDFMKGYAAYKAKNYNEAFKQYTIAANKGYDVGMVQLGLLYMQGLGVTEDRKETLKWFQKAADIGNINAMFMVGMAYSSGNLGPKDLKIAEQWFLKSANLGKTESMYYMGRLFEYGLAGSLDLNKAKEWYKKAADKGNEDAKQKLISLANNLPTNIKTVAAPPTPIKPIINKNVSWLGKNGLYGIVDRTGKIIVQPQYDNPLGFNKNGIAIVTKNKKKGLINNNGKELTPFEYDSDLGETDGLFLLRKRKPTPDNILNDETYFLDGTGKIVLTDTDKPYKIESPFYSERAMVRTTNGTGYIDKKGKMVISDIYTSGSLIGSSPYWFTDGVAVIKRKENNEIILIDINGKVLTQKNYMTIGGNTSLFIRQQWESIFTYSVTGGKKGYLDKNGKEITAAIYDDVFPFREGRGKVKVGKNTFKQGFVDKAGKEIIPLIYDGVNDFSDGLAAVEVKGRWGFIDVLGNMVIQPQFENVGDFSEGLARVAITQKDGKRRSGFINKKGEWVIAPQFENNFGKFTEGLAGININGYWGFINTKGELVIQPKYKKYGFTSFEDGLKFFEGENYRYFYIDKTGKEFKEQ